MLEPTTIVTATMATMATTPTTTTAKPATATTATAPTATTTRAATTAAARHRGAITKNRQIAATAKGHFWETKTKDGWLRETTNTVMTTEEREWW